jgi:hypothetical protein
MLTKRWRTSYRLCWVLLGFLLLVSPGVARAQRSGSVSAVFEETADCGDDFAAGAEAAPSAVQQQPAALPDRPQPNMPQPNDGAQNTPASGATAAEANPRVHRFWDETNAWLFAGVAASRALDYTSTKNFRRRGRNEGLLTNAIVDNDPLFAAIEISATAASIGVSYLFHVHGHHSLERWTSIVHMSVAFFGDARNYALKTVHPPPQ